MLLLSIAIQTAFLLQHATATLTVVIKEDGKITYSADGVASKGTGQVGVYKKSADATLRTAAIACSTNFRGSSLKDADVYVLDQPVDFTNFGSVESRPGFLLTSAYGDITAILKDTLDNAPAGITNISVRERRQSITDGCGVWAVFDDPSVNVTSTFIFQFGAQEHAGDSFTMTIPSPLTKSDDVAEFGLAIGFGYQPTNSYPQYSEVRVNGELLTAYAGGFDDGFAANGGLITVGGLNDTPTNPDPNAKVIEDELYDLVPFFQESKTALIETINPSSDDLIFGASLFVTAQATIENPNSDETCVKDEDCQSPLTCCRSNFRGGLRHRSLLYGGFVNSGVCVLTCA